MSESPMNPAELLLSLFTSFTVIVLLYLNVVLLLHCFYDETIRLTRKRILFTILGYIPVMLLLSIAAVLFGIVCGYMEAKLDLPDMMNNDRGDVLLTAGSMQFLFWPAVMTAVGTGIRFRKVLLRFHGLLPLHPAQHYDIAALRDAAVLPHGDRHIRQTSAR